MSWNPSHITEFANASLYCWLDSADAATITESAGLVSGWLDKSSNAFTFSASGAQRPTTGSTSQNSLNTLDFAGDDRLTSDSAASSWAMLSDAGPKWVFVVVKLGNIVDPNLRYGIVSTGAMSSAVRGYDLSYDDRSFVPRDNAISQLVSTGNNPSTAPVDHSAQFTFVTSNQYSILGALSTPELTPASARSSLYNFDNIWSGFNTSSTGHTNGTPAHTLRIGSNGANAFGLEGQIGEILILEGPLTTAERNIVFGYLAHRWGLTAELVTAHPYKTTPPIAPGEGVIASIPTAAGAPAAVLSSSDELRVLIPSAAGSPLLTVLYSPEVNARALFSSAAGSFKTKLLNDFSSQITDPVARYSMRLMSDPPLNIPISSWQATLQTGRLSYLQAVIPAYPKWAQFLSDSVGVHDFQVFRTLQTTAGPIELAVSTAPLQSVSLSGGAVNQTATVSGYSNTFLNAVSSGSRDLKNTRQRSQSSSGSARARADIDLFLTPGQTVTSGDLSFTADYINYYVPSSGDAYMDLGSRGSG